MHTQPASAVAFRPRNFLARIRPRLIQWAIFLITVQLVLAPIMPIIIQSFLDRPLYDQGLSLTLENYEVILSTSSLWQAVWNSLLFATLATIFSQVLGAILAILIGRTNIPGRNILGDLLIWPLVISSLVIGFGWFLAYGPAGFVTLFIRDMIGTNPWNIYSIGGMALVAGSTNVPLAMLFCLGSLALSNSSLEDASRVAGARPMQTIWSITLPLLVPSLLYSGILNFTSTISTLSIPLIFGEPVGLPFFTTFLYKAGLSASVDYGVVSTAALLLLAIILFLVGMQRLLLGNVRRFVTVGGKASRSKPFSLGKLKWLAFGFVLFYVLFFVLFPIGVLALRASVRFLTPLVPFWGLFTADNFIAIFSLRTILRSISNTFIVSAGGAAIGTIFIFTVALIVRRSDFPLRQHLEYFALTPRALPGIVAGIGFFYAAVFFPPVGWLAGTIWILMAAYIMGAIPTGFGAISPSLLQLSPDFERSARIIGADWWTSANTIVLPLLKPALFTCFALLFLSFFKEYTVAVFLVSPGNEVIGTTLLQLWQQGVMGQVAALATFQIIVTVAFLIVARNLLGIKIYG